jgi:hypothetical protein
MPRARSIWQARATAALVVALLASRPAAAATSPANTGTTQHLVSVRDSPGYVPLHDPDSLAETLGRRPDAPIVSTPFDGGSRSLEALARAVCGALHTNSPDSLLRLCVRSDEFRVILWPEFPQSRPATGLRWDDAWPVLWGRLNGGSVSATRELGGHVYTFQKLERTAATVSYKNFKLHNGITIVAKDDEGGIQRFTFIRSIAERKGRFKLYSMSD